MCWSQLSHWSRLPQGLLSPKLIGKLLDHFRSSHRSRRTKIFLFRLPSGTCPKRRKAPLTFPKSFCRCPTQFPRRGRLARRSATSAIAGRQTSATVRLNGFLTAIAIADANSLMTATASIPTRRIASATHANPRAIFAGSAHHSRTIVLCLGAGLPTAAIAAVSLLTQIVPAAAAPVLRFAGTEPVNRVAAKTAITVQMTAAAVHAVMAVSARSK